MPRVTVHKAKTELSKLIRRALAGEEIVIARGDVPVVRLVPVVEEPPKRSFGVLRGELTVTPEFFEPLPPGELEVWES